MNGLVTEKRQYFRIVYFCLAEKIPRFSKEFVCPAEPPLGTMGLFLGWGLLDFIMKVYEYLIKLICFISKRFLNTPLDISP